MSESIGAILRRTFVKNHCDFMPSLCLRIGELYDITLSTGKAVRQNKMRDLHV